MNNCNTCKHFNGGAVVGLGDEPCYSCLKSKEQYLPSYEDSREKITNADRIRSMSDEELAILLSGMSCRRCPINCKGGYMSCSDYWRDWLKEEATH